jgi:DnaK suppressor protein
MPAFTESQLKRFLATLSTREVQLRGEVQAINQDDADTPAVADLHAQVEDFGERGEHRLRAEVRFAEKERDIDELIAIAGAKERLARGVYGECIDCGIDIPPARLKVSPASARCLRCQEKFELVHPIGPRILQTP